MPFLVEEPERFEPCCAWTVDGGESAVSIREEECHDLVLASTDTSVGQEATIECRYGGASESVDVTIAAVD